MTSPDLAACKEKLRSELLQSRRAVSGADADRAARRVAEYVAALPTFQAADAVALYASLPDELPTRPLFDAVHASGKAVLLPRFDGDSLVFAQAEHWDDLRRGRYGVAEPPVGAAAVRPRSLVVLPGVAFDREGNRLGRGGGHYDRAFADTPVGQPMLVGVGWDFQRVDRVPHGPADRRLDAVVTEAGVFEAGETT